MFQLGVQLCSSPCVRVRGVDGPHGSRRPLPVVHAKQRNHCLILVWHAVQGKTIKSIFNHLHQLSSLVFQAMYLPWVLFGFNLIIQGSGVMELIGILIGHLYFFLMFKYPQDFGGASLLKTPQIFYEWFPNQAGGVHGFGGGQTTGIDTKSNHSIFHGTK